MVVSVVLVVVVLVVVLVLISVVVITLVMQMHVCPHVRFTDCHRPPFFVQTSDFIPGKARSMHCSSPFGLNSAMPPYSQRNTLPQGQPAGHWGNNWASHWA